MTEFSDSPQSRGAKNGVKVFPAWATGSGDTQLLLWGVSGKRVCRRGEAGKDMAGKILSGRSKSEMPVGCLNRRSRGSWIYGH